MYVQPAELDLLRSALQIKKQVVALTGAGISVASGLPLARERFEGVPISEILTRKFFVRHPAQFYRWYRRTVETWSKARPNYSHLFLQKRGIHVITQNIDSLHPDSPQSRVIELHGSIRGLICPRCVQRMPNHYAQMDKVPACPTCAGILHPDVVFVGEPVRHFSAAVDLTCRAEVLVVIGTKLNMQPCKDLVGIAEKNRTPIVRINKEAERILANLDERI